MVLGSPFSAETPTSDSSLPPTPPLPEPIARGGKRGPLPSSCDACRKLRAKCTRPAREDEASACERCIRKGIECTPLEPARRRRRTVTPHVVEQQAVVPRTEQTIVATHVSGARASNLFDLYFDVSTVGLESNFIPLVFHDATRLRGRFEEVANKFDELEPDEQLRCRLVWAAASRRQSISNQAVVENGSTDALKNAQEAADRFAIWRKPTRSNFTSLLLLYYITAFGDLAAPDAQYYLAAACSQVHSLFPTTESLFRLPVGVPEWGIWTLSITDVSRALETRGYPFLSDRDFAVLLGANGPNYVAPIEHLASFLPHEPWTVLAKCTHTMTHITYTARVFAYLASQPPGSATSEQDLHALPPIWERLDTYDTWIRSCLALTQTATASEVNAVDLAMLQSALKVIWLPSALIEHSILTYLRDRLANGHGSAGPMSPRLPDSPKASSLTSLQAVAIARSAQALCTLLRETRNRDGIYHLVVAAGYFCSVTRLNDLATSLLNADPDDFDLFPLGAPDKLASVTFFIRTLKNARQIYRCETLGDSIASLSKHRTKLETETGYSGESALTLFTSISLDSPLEVPDTPPPSLAEAAVAIHRGSFH